MAALSWFGLMESNKVAKTTGIVRRTWQLAIVIFRRPSGNQSWPPIRGGKQSAKSGGVVETRQDVSRDRK